MVYEAAFIHPDGPEVTLWIDLTPEELAAASPDALRLGRYYQRRPHADAFLRTPLEIALKHWWELAAREQPICVYPDQAARLIARLTSGLHLVAACPAFDAGMLGRLLQAHGLPAAWHYHLVDVEALAAGKLGAGPPWQVRELAAALGVPAQPPELAHTALADARWVQAMYTAIIG